jgi:RNA polymerase sigma-70 factor (ECF subfamily)
MSTTLAVRRDAACTGERLALREMGVPEAATSAGPTEGRVRTQTPTSAGPTEGRVRTQTPTSAGPTEGRVRTQTPTFREIYAQEFAYVWRNARRLGVSPVWIDDVVQDVFVAIHRRLPERDLESAGRDLRPLRSWIFGILLGIVRNHRRSLRRKGGESRASAEHPEAVRTESAVEQADAVRVLYEILDDLEEARREVLVMSELEGYTAPEIADLTGATLNTVYTRIRLARKDFESAVARRRAREGWRWK